MMDIKVALSTFAIIFFAELGDKTQLATLSFAAESKSPVSVFVGAACALIFTSVLAVLFGSLLGKWIPENAIKLGAGGLFLVLGIWIIVSTYLKW